MAQDKSKESVDLLIAAVKRMATNCQLENCEQISEVRGATGAVLMIEQEFLALREEYLKKLRLLKAE